MSASQELSPSSQAVPAPSLSDLGENSSNAGRIGEAEGADSPTPTGDYRTVRTLYACVAEHETELSFEPNQIIAKGEKPLFCVESKIVTQLIFCVFFSVRPSLEPGWLEGYLDGKFGLVPENYVEFIT